LMANTVPEPGDECDHCQYRKAAHGVIAEQMKSASNENKSSKEDDDEGHNKQQSLL